MVASLARAPVGQQLQQVGDADGSVAVSGAAGARKVTRAARRAPTGAKRLRPWQYSIRIVRGRPDHSTSAVSVSTWRSVVHRSITNSPSTNARMPSSAVTSSRYLPGGSETSVVATMPKL